MARKTPAVEPVETVTTGASKLRKYQTEYEEAQRNGFTEDYAKFASRHTSKLRAQAKDQRLVDDFNARNQQRAQPAKKAQPKPLTHSALNAKIIDDLNLLKSNPDQVWTYILNTFSDVVGSVNGMTIKDIVDSLPAVEDPALMQQPTDAPIKQDFTPEELAKLVGVSGSGQLTPEQLKEAVHLAFQEIAARRRDRVRTRKEEAAAQENLNREKAEEERFQARHKRHPLVEGLEVAFLQNYTPSLQDPTYGFVLRTFKRNAQQYPLYYRLYDTRNMTRGYRSRHEEELIGRGAEARGRNPLYNAGLPTGRDESFIAQQVQALAQSLFGDDDWVFRGIQVHETFEMPDVHTRQLFPLHDFGRFTGQIIIDKYTRLNVGASAESSGYYPVGGFSIVLPFDGKMRHYRIQATLESVLPADVPLGEGDARYVAKRLAELLAATDSSLIGVAHVLYQASPTGNEERGMVTPAIDIDITV